MAQQLLNERKDSITEFQFVSDEDKKLNAQVNAEVADMEEYAKASRDTAKEAIKGYMALSKPPVDGKSQLWIPKVHAVTYSRMSMEAANLPDVQYRFRKETERKKEQFINAARKNAETGDGNMKPDAINLWFQQNFQKILFGVGFRYLSYLLQKRTIRVRDDQGKIRERTEIVYDDIWDEVPDFFHVGVSRDMQVGMYGGSACYMDKFFLKDAARERFRDNPYYDSAAIDYALTRTDWMNDGDEQYPNWSVPDGYVRVRWYWNVFKNLMYVQMNGIPIRKDFIQDYGDWKHPRTFLPITSIHNDFSFDQQSSSLPSIVQSGRQYQQDFQSTTNLSFWTKSDVHLVKGLIGFSNAIWRAAVDHTKYSSVNFLTSSHPGLRDMINSADLYGVVPLPQVRPEDFNVTQLSKGEFLTNFQAMDEAVDNLMTYSLGNDWRRSASELTNEKATVAAIRQQVQRVRMQQNMTFNETGGIKRHYRILLNLIWQYYPEKVLKDLAPGEEIPEGTTEEDIVRDMDGKPIQVKTPRSIPTDEDLVVFRSGDRVRTLTPSHEEAKGKVASRSFPAYRELLVSEEEPEVYIEPGSTFEQMKMLDRELMDQKMNRLVQLSGISYPSGQTDAAGMPIMEPLVPKEGMKYELEQWLRAWDDDPETFFGRDSAIEDEDRQIDDQMKMPFEHAFPEAPTPAPSKAPMFAQQKSGQSTGTLAKEMTP